MRRIMIIGGLFVAIGLVPCPAAEIELTNGDRITGDIIKETDKAITVKTLSMGTVNIEKSYVRDESAAEEEMAENQPPASPWKRKLALGYSQTGGNTKRGHGNVNLSAKRKTEKDEWLFKYEAHYSSTNDKMDGRKFYGLGRYAFSFGRLKRWYNFYKYEADHDRFSNVDYRLIPSGGLGFWFADEERWKAMAEMAIGYEYTNYIDTSSSEGAVILVPRGFVEKHLWDNFIASQEVVMYPSLEDVKEYRLRSETALTHKINAHLSWKFSFIDEYNSAPKGSADKNDYRLVSALEYLF